MSILDGSNRPGSSLGPVVTPAPKTVGAYLQTSTRQLIPDSKLYSGARVTLLTLVILVKIDLFNGLNQL